MMIHLIVQLVVSDFFGERDLNDGCSTRSLTDDSTEDLTDDSTESPSDGSTRGPSDDLTEGSSSDSSGDSTDGSSECFKFSVVRGDCLPVD
jgi:hypothetical protein